MKTLEVMSAWRKILKGEQPSLSIEITRECPLKCPGCYAYGDNHLGGSVTLRGLRNFKGQELIDGVMECVDALRPLHVSLVGGDPLVHHRELQVLVPRLIERGIYVQVVTSAFRPLPSSWAELSHLNVVVSIDGLQPEHDLRRAPATYERILRNISGQRVTVHTTITGQMMKRPGYLKEFLAFWSPRAEIRKMWFSLFTPQRGDRMPEILEPAERARAIADMFTLREAFPKLDMPKGLIQQFATPPRNPEECVFALTTRTISADLKTRVAPCQFGGNPDCGSCGCVASMGLAAVAAHKLGGIIPVGALFRASLKIGQSRASRVAVAPVENPLRFGLGKAEQTERILRAMDNRYFTILGHATGRLLLRRPGYEIDVKRVVQHARDSGCFFEINSSPDRLDLSAENARMAAEAGVRIAINTDAHGLRDFDLIRYGVGQARRAGLARDMVLNCMSWDELGPLLAGRRM